jgi:hypothetical protein
MQRLNLVDEAHKALAELSKIRSLFQNGEIDNETAKQATGLFNATSRSIGMSINAEKWYSAKQKHTTVKK